MRDSTPKPAIALALVLLLAIAACSPAPIYRDVDQRPQGKRWVETGIASWYGGKFHGRHTASGEVFDMNRVSAAHKSLPFGTRVKVTNLDNGRQLVVRINDRGPFIKGRILDCSREAARQLGFLDAGIAQVRLEVVKWGAPGAE